VVGVGVGHDATGVPCTGGIITGGIITGGRTTGGMAPAGGVVSLPVVVPAGVWPVWLSTPRAERAWVGPLRRPMAATHVKSSARAISAGATRCHEVSYTLPLCAHTLAGGMVTVRRTRGRADGNVRSAGAGSVQAEARAVRVVPTLDFSIVSPALSVPE